MSGEGFASLVGLILVAITVAYTCCSTPDENDVRQTLRGHGFRDVKLEGTQPFTCHNGEQSQAFTARNPNGDRVEGVVCCGLIGKGCTVRWDP